MGEEPSEVLRYEDLLSLLPECLPELEEAYRVEREWWGGEEPGPHAIYGDLLNPHIDRLLHAADTAALLRVFALLERLARSSDIRVRECATPDVSPWEGDAVRRVGCELER